jgi:hypothetical protein
VRVVAVQPQQSTCLREAVGCEITTDGCERMCQLLPVLSVASIPESAEPTSRCGLAKRRCGCERLLLACVRCSQQHRPHLAVVGQRVAPLSSVRHAGGLPDGYRRGRRPPTACLCTVRKSITSQCPKRRRTKCTRSLIFVRTPYLRRDAAISATSPNQEGVEGTDSEVLWNNYRSIGDTSHMCLLEGIC